MSATFAVPFDTAYTLVHCQFSAITLKAREFDQVSEKVFRHDIHRRSHTLVFQKIMCSRSESTLAGVDLIHYQSHKTLQGALPVMDDDLRSLKGLQALVAQKPLLSH